MVLVLLKQQDICTYALTTGLTIRFPIKIATLTVENQRSMTLVTSKNLSGQSKSEVSHSTFMERTSYTPTCYANAVSDQTKHGAFSA